MPKISSLGALSSRGFGEFAQQTAANYIEDVFSTYLYTGNGTYSPKTGVNTINNGIDLLGKGGLVWAKIRGDVTGSHALFDTARGVSQLLSSNLTDAQTLYSGYGVTSFNSNGFTLEGNLYGENQNGKSDVAWTFRKQPKFFDVVTYTGNGTSQNISHNLGSVPGFIIVKNITSALNWATYHRSLGAGYSTPINSTSAALSTTSVWNSTEPTSTQFTVGSAGTTNEAGSTHVAYLFAHNAGGFGADGSQNAISCGSFSAGTTVDVNLGYEPQYVLLKCASSAGSWWVSDTMRGMSNTDWYFLQPNVVDAEANTGAGTVIPTATGFTFKGANLGLTAGQTMIYMAIRRGPMRTPTSGTNVFQPIYDATSLANKTNGTVGPVDMTWQGEPTGNYPVYWLTAFERLIGSKYLVTSQTYAEAAGGVSFDTNVGVKNATWFTAGGICYNFGRAPGFFDTICYTGTGVSTTQSHNLGVAPELMIFKSRNIAGTNWAVCIPLTSTTYNYLTLQSANLANNRTYGPGGSPNFEELSAPPTSSVINLASSAELNASGRIFVTYLFASCPGVSKVGTYTGTGGTQTISCGFTGGARFVMIKRTDTTGDWYAWDTARGMVAGTDYYLLINSSVAQVNSNSVYTTTGGFQIVSTAAGINASGGTYIYLAIA